MTRAEKAELLRDIAAERILVKDGPYGSMIQSYRLDEAGFRGGRDFAHDQKGNNDLLEPDPARRRERDLQRLSRRRRRHRRDQHLQRQRHQPGRLRHRQAWRARSTSPPRSSRAPAPTPQRRATPTSRASSPARWAPPTRRCRCRPTSTIPGYRAVTFDEVKGIYREQIEGLLDGGVDFILIETVFDTLNAKAALVAADEAAEERGEQLPVMVSMTLTDLAGRNLSGQTVEAFWHSVRHARPLTIGLNCSFGATELHPYVNALNPQVDGLVCVYPNAGLPNEFGAYDEPPEMTAKLVRGWAENGWLNIVGGCCGTTPAHISAIAEAVKGVKPRQWHALPPALRLSGMEAASFFDVRGNEQHATGQVATFINIGERTNVTGSARFKKLILDGDYAAAVEVARQQVESGAQIIDVNMDEGLLDAEQAMDTFLKLIAAEPDIARVPVMIDSSKWSVIEAGLKCVQGKPIVNSISMKEGEEPFIEHARKVRRYGAAVVVMAFDEKGQADSRQRKVEICSRAYDILVEQGRLPGRGHHLRSQHLRRRHRHRGAQQLRRRLHRGDARDQGSAART